MDILNNIFIQTIDNNRKEDYTMFYINCFLCLLLTAGIIYTLYLAFKRNKTIEVKGKDDFLSTMIILFICIIAFPITDITSIIEVLRTILLYLFLFSTFCIKRGINEKGINKIFFIIPWNKITRIEISSFQTTKFSLLCYTDNYKFKLIFHNFQIKKVLLILNKFHKDNIKIEQSIQNSILNKK